MIRCNYFAVQTVCWNNQADLHVMVTLLQGLEIKLFKVTVWRGNVQGPEFAYPEVPRILIFFALSSRSVNGTDIFSSHEIF